MSTEKQVAVNRHHRETVLAETRKSAERLQQEYTLQARRRRLTISPVEMPTPGNDARHQQLLQQILKFDAVFDSLKLATHSRDKQVSTTHTDTYARHNPPSDTQTHTHGITLPQTHIHTRTA